MSTVAYLVRLTGRVQGVGFRWHTRAEARATDVRGWVMNEDDGSVTVRLEGDDDRVEELLGWLEIGPAGAQVESVDVETATPDGARGFEIR